MMRVYYLYIIILIAFTSCTRQPTLPDNSKFNVTGVLNDTVWYGTGKVLRLREATQEAGQVRKFNLLVYTDIDYPGVGKGPNPKTSNGCLDPECTKTQALVIYNIPLKKGRFKIGKLDKRSQHRNEYASLSYIGNAGGLMNRYVYRGGKPGWIRVTKFRKEVGIVEGRFDISFQQDMEADLLPLRNKMPGAARFTNGLFRIKLTEVLLK